MNQDKRAGWQMPVWLVEWEMERDPEGWVQRALRWGWVEEALDWIAELLRRVSVVYAGCEGTDGNRPLHQNSCRPPGRMLHTSHTT